MKKMSLILLFFFLIGTTAESQNVSKVGTTAAPFLNIGVGSRAVAMGGAFVATSDDATALYWNVAGISRVNKNQVLLDHSEWLAGINFDFAGAVLNLENIGTVGVSFTSLSMGNMERTTELQPEGTGEKFAAGSFAIGVAYVIGFGKTTFIKCMNCLMFGQAFIEDIRCLLRTYLFAESATYTFHFIYIPGFSF
jgi:hypothetical protein